MTEQQEERWIEFEACTVEEDEQVPNFDIFGDPDPYENFTFSFSVPMSATAVDKQHSDGYSYTEGPKEDPEGHDDGEKREIRIALKGYKHEHERIFDSTGLTLWRASRLLCEFMCSNPQYIQNKSVLELGAGLGLCGLLAYNLQASNVVMTDGDTDVLAEMRRNVDHNLKNNEIENENGSDNVLSVTSRMSSDGIIPCRQLRWGQQYIDPFKTSITNNSWSNNDEGSFDVIIASDVVYVEYVLDDLFDTIVGMLSSSPDARFYLAYARRAVDISAVFECASNHGLVWTVPQETEGVYVFSRNIKG